MIKLGESNAYPDRYDPSLLEAIPRSLARSQLPHRADGGPIEFLGFDLWTAFELSWLQRNGFPVCYIAEIYVPANSTAICESKSLKYYLNSLNQQRFALPSDAVALIKQDLQAIVGQHVEIKIFEIDDYHRRSPSDKSKYRLLEQELDTGDALSIDDNSQPEALAAKLYGGDSPDDSADDSGLIANTRAPEGFYASHLLKTNCPLTGQPDWASLFIGVKGTQPNPVALLRYIVSYRSHQDYHEHCVERIFSDLLLNLEPEELYVYARYTRRGGIDINPLRRTEGWENYLIDNFATFRQ